ncbi:bifunctional methylenetetrahydrofolate dehydrogenase/methenyltetrahydrofolate cyclohydrolase FolD [Emcibacter sp. SYSU 3D8]|uniref:bifunctional methylenetetrahydrofolate dehydrogenase/methenyltetrahydrofolate cyclohydrolase FolD n=1 Tax=Emcibacter sp. SYSU 3D8 TaxID=3133969 RepID=UPI0031FF146F
MSEAAIIDGKAFAANLRGKVARQVAALKADHGLTPGLAVVLVGADPASEIYVRNKHTQTTEAGMNSFEFKRPADITQDALLGLVRELNADSRVHGILVQLPLPKPLVEQPVTQAIDPDKDVDGLHVINAGRLASGLPGLFPCTPSGCMMLIEDQLGADLSGKRAIVLGRSNLVGKPIAQMLLRANATVTMAHSRTDDLPAECRRADIVVAAVGKPDMVRGGWIKHGAVVIDVGINRIPKDGGGTRVVGDVCFAEAKDRAAAITPVPGGVGPMTIATLLHNTVIAACRQAGVEEPKV